MFSKNQDLFRNKVTIVKLIKIKRNIFSIFEKSEFNSKQSSYFEIIVN